MEVVSKPCQDGFLHPILVHSILEKKKNIGSQMGHTKIYLRKNNISICKTVYLFGTLLLKLDSQIDRSILRRIHRQLSDENSELRELLRHYIQSLSASRCQFHQHFTNIFFVYVKLFSYYILSIVIF